MKITVWMATRERATWIAAVEVLGLALVLLITGASGIPLMVGLLLLAHLGYSAMTSLPIGSIPGRPSGAAQRRNLDLRSRVVAFLNEVRRVEAYAHRAHSTGRPPAEVEENLRTAQRRVMAAAAEVAKVSGRAAAQEAASGVIVARVATDNW